MGAPILEERCAFTYMRMRQKAQQYGTPAPPLYSSLPIERLKWPSAVTTLTTYYPWVMYQICRFGILGNLIHVFEETRYFKSVCT